MHRLLVLLLLSLAWSLGHAACSETLVAVPRSSTVSIGDGGCSYDQEMIINGVRARVGPLPDKVTTVPFDSQCQRTSNGFACKQNGTTVLAGAAYKKVAGSKKVCGDRKWPIYRCVSGCAQPGTPIAFEIEPYEC